ncbi:MAG: TrbG/VirB9 family P-type conjugative transfer protein [Sphingomonas sp.]|uniref:TrbG/VirB9 family P-type conjugative transfer protein n=1 Tax=Sphingomonas sp. TaxID=28214 RepID=UPI001B2608D2|nr:TrbG/VirB9 family P-type conjugative transfer protein [Sphingomonas sp.]MBO9622407.1 TrbG/VirB9 family P-type conjugative transfer protein [Sphingomonas sp.]
MRLRGALLLIALAVPAAPAAAQELPADARVRIVDFQPDQVVRIEGAPGYQLVIELAPDEQIVSVALGDSSAWQVTANRAGSHLIVKAVQGGVSTNLTVITSVRAYHFDLAPSYAPTIYSLRFRYPPPPPTIASLPVGLTNRYKLSGKRSLWPSRMADDGERTFVEWPKNVDLPAVFAVDTQGKETLVNGMMRDDRLVIDSIAKQFVFRLDGNVARAKRQVREPRAEKR